MTAGPPYAVAPSFRKLAAISFQFLVKSACGMVGTSASFVWAGVWLAITPPSRVLPDWPRHIQGFFLSTRYLLGRFDPAEQPPQRQVIGNFDDATHNVEPIWCA
jgi:hypothetical protein